MGSAKLSAQDMPKIYEKSDYKSFHTRSVAAWVNKNHTHYCESGDDGEKHMTEKESEEAKDIGLHQNKTKHDTKLCTRHGLYIGTWNV